MSGILLPLRCVPLILLSLIYLQVEIETKIFALRTFRQQFIVSFRLLNNYSNLSTNKNLKQK